MFAVARLDAPHAFARIDDGNQFFAGGVHFGEDGFLGVGFVGEGAVFVRKISSAAIQFQFAVGAELGELFRRRAHFHHAGVEVGDEYPVGLVIFRREAEGVGLDAEVDIFADKDGGVFRLRFLDARGIRQNPVVHRIFGQNRLAAAIFVEADFQLAAIRQIHARAQAAFAAKTVEHPRHRAGVAAQLGGFALEAVNLLDDFDGHEDVVLLKIEERIGVVEQDVSVEDIVFHRLK